MGKISIILSIIGVISALDIITFTLQSAGRANNLTYYICRPLWGILELSMFNGLLVRIIEVIIATFCIHHLIINFIQ